MKDKISKLLACPFAVFAFIAAISAFSLAAALTAEIVYKLEPCILCIYQRIPFTFALMLSLLGMGICKFKKDGNTMPSVILLKLNAALFFINAAIAAYHTGIERHWWKSAVQGCAVPGFGGESETILENILSAPAARCDEIPWADPVLGLSMANYNVMLCFGLFLICLFSAFKIKSSQHS